MSSSMPTCRALLVDLDGVLRRWPQDDAHIEVPLGLPVGAIRREAFEPALLEHAITGRISDEAWRDEIVSRLADCHGRAHAEAAVAQWSRPVGLIDADVWTLLMAARARVRLVLVTNATSRLDADLSVLGLIGSFDAVANSSRIGAAKPHMAMFAAALSLAGVSAEEALFVDDSRGNVAAAQALGIRGCVFEGAVSLRRFLESHGVVTG